MSERRLDGRHVLVVDDDPDIRGSIDLALRSEGARTSTAGDGATAVHLGQAERPDAVVLDMMLPRQSGFLVLEKLHEQDEPPVVVMITANQGRRHMEYARTLGVSAYLTKPVALQRLVDTLADLLAAPGGPAAAGGEAAPDDDPDASGTGDAARGPDAD
jgi:DNA-binding response OmpR family regulator